MSKVVAEISMSLDGFVAGPNDGRGCGLGEGGEPLHNWVMGGAWTYQGGTPFKASGVDREVIDEMFANAGASVVGRRMYDVVDGWGDNDTFGFPVFVLTSRAHERREVGTTSYTFVTDGVRAAVEQAREAAGDRDVAVGGGARTIQQAIAAGLVEELHLHLAPVLLGRGTRLFENLGTPLPKLEPISLRESPNATHIHYRVTAPG